MPAAGYHHTALLRSDGRAVACGSNGDGQCDLPDLELGASYTQVVAGWSHTVLLRSDGQAVACGRNANRQCELPELEPGAIYTQVAAGLAHTVLLRSDGRAVACGLNDDGQCDVPVLEPGAIYRLRPEAFILYCCAATAEPWLAGAVTTASGTLHTVLLRGDGRAVACGLNDDGRCDLPELEPGTSYTQVAAGAMHTVLLRSDGCAVACGSNCRGQCDLPELDPGTNYIQVAAGVNHTALLRSDGRAVACGNIDEGECDLPELELGMRYCTNGILLDLVLQLVIEGGGGDQTTCRNLLTGEALATWSIEELPRGERVFARLRAELSRPGARLRVVGSDGSLLSESCTWAEIFQR